jgi:hypothetical protein
MSSDAGDTEEKSNRDARRRFREAGVWRELCAIRRLRDGPERERRWAAWFAEAQVKLAGSGCDYQAVQKSYG